MADSVQRWNHNIHYHRRILRAIPVGARSALEVGTGNGLLAAELRRMVPEVTAIDSDRTVLDEARRVDPGVQWVHGDVLDHPLPTASFDVVASVATLHHFSDLEHALRRFVELTAPGGVVAVVGLARSARPKDALYDMVGAAQHQWYSRRYQMWEHSAPTVWPPPHTYSVVHATAAQVMPGVTWTRLPLWRYALTWTKPPL